MPADNVWGDPRTWTVIWSICVGFVGLLYGIISANHNRGSKWSD
jgi:hypothetical protein